MNDSSLIHSLTMARYNFYDYIKPIFTGKVIHCPDPGDLKHGYLSDGDFTYGSVVMYSCDRGYTLVGSGKRKCTVLGRWSGRRPVCRGKNGAGFAF